MRADQGVRLPDEVWARCKQSGLRRLLVGVESGSNEMLKRIRKDIKIEQVFQTAEKMLQHDIAGHFPFIVGFPDESDASIQATLDCAKRLRSLSPDFLTPIYYFKPYPGSELVIEAVARGFRLPETLDAWSAFDYVAGMPGPWVIAGEVPAHRALQVLPRAGLEAGVARQEAAAAAGALSLQHGRLSLAGRDAADPLGGAGAEAVMSASAACPAHQPDHHRAAPRALPARGAESVRGARGPARQPAFSTATSIATSSPPRCARWSRAASTAVGVTVMGGPQLTVRDRGLQGDPRAGAGRADHLGRRFSDRLSRRRR